MACSEPGWTTRWVQGQPGLACQNLVAKRIEGWGTSQWYSTCLADKVCTSAMWLPHQKLKAMGHSDGVLQHFESELIFTLRKLGNPVLFYYSDKSWRIRISRCKFRRTENRQSNGQVWVSCQHYQPTAVNDNNPNVHQRMDEQDMIHSNHRTQFSQRNIGSMNSCWSLDEPWKPEVKRKKSDTKGHVSPTPFTRNISRESGNRQQVSANQGLGKEDLE